MGKEESGSAAAEKLKRLFDDEWEFRLAENPFLATSMGDHRADDKLPSSTLEDIDRRHAKSAEFLRELETIDRKELSPDDQLNYDIFKRLKGNEVEGHKFRSFLMPISKTGGFHGSFPEMSKRVPLNTSGDYENYISRLGEFSRYVDEHIELMRIGMKEGYMRPRVTLVGVEESMKPHIVDDPSGSLLFKPFESFRRQ